MQALAIAGEVVGEAAQAVGWLAICGGLCQAVVLN